MGFDQYGRELFTWDGFWAMLRNIIFTIIVLGIFLLGLWKLAELIF